MQAHESAEAGDEVRMAKIIAVVERRAIVLTAIGSVAAVGFGATKAVTVTVPEFAKDIFQLNWKILLAFGPITAVIAAYIISALFWGALISLFVWAISRLSYFSRLPDGLFLGSLSPLQTDAFETRLAKATRRAGEWISCRIAGEVVRYRISVGICSFVVIVVMLISIFIRSQIEK
jgi:hypothetical protein